jgi:hypothetical protein
MGHYVNAIDFYEQRLALARKMQDNRIEEHVLGA